MMTFHLGPISTIVTHLETASPDVADAMHTLCRRAGTMPPMKVGELHIATRTADQVTCQECLEWMHA